MIHYSRNLLLTQGNKKHLDYTGPLKETLTKSVSVSIFEHIASRLASDFFPSLVLRHTMSDFVKLKCDDVTQSSFFPFFELVLWFAPSEFLVVNV